MVTATVGLNADVLAMRYCRPTGSGYLPVVVEHHEGKEEVGPVGHEGEKANRATIGRARGRATRRNTPHSPQPSTHAAARSSSGSSTRRRCRTDRPRTGRTQTGGSPSRRTDEVEEVHLEEQWQDQSAGRHDHHQQGDAEKHLPADELASVPSRIQRGRRTPRPGTRRRPSTRQSSPSQRQQFVSLETNILSQVWIRCGKTRTPGGS